MSSHQSISSLFPFKLPLLLLLPFLITPSPLLLCVARETAVHSVAVHLLTLSFYYLWVRCLIRGTKLRGTKEQLALSIFRMLVTLNTRILQWLFTQIFLSLLWVNTLCTGCKHTDPVQLICYKSCLRVNFISQESIGPRDQVGGGSDGNMPQPMVARREQCTATLEETHANRQNIWLSSVWLVRL